MTEPEAPETGVRHQPAPGPPEPAGPEPAGPEPASPDRPVKKTERPHPLTPFIRGWLVLVAIILGFSRQLVESTNSSDGFGTSDLVWLLPVATVVVLAAGGVGFVSWYFTRFVIDDEELRIETGALFKQSTKVPFERLQSVDIIQPLAARLFGLAELRLEAGAGGSGIKLRYLRQSEASRLRDYLLTRAHGTAASIADARQEAPASRLTDLGRADRPLVTVSPQRLIGSFLLSTEWLLTAAFAVIVLIVSAVGAAVALTGLIPVAVSLFSQVGNRVVAMFNFTLAESARGLRITRGLTNLTSQSVPIDRIQGIKITQPMLWRPLGWYRVDVDILGYGGADTDEASAGSSALLPVATADQVRLALDYVLPGVDLDRVPMIRPPRRAAWVRPFDYWTLRSGLDDRVLVTERGWLNHERHVVPHAKSQSVRLWQGPLQRRLGLADVHVDTPRGPVNAIARQMEARAARALVLSQLDRARTARRAELARAALPIEQVREAAILDHFGIGPERRLGAGGESGVYALDEDRVLRIYHSGHEATAQVIAQLRGLLSLWEPVAPFALPTVLETGERAGRLYTVNRRLRGMSLDHWLAQADPPRRPEALLDYLNTAARIQQLPVPVPGFARLVGAGAPQSFGSLVDLLNAQLQPQLAVSRSRLDADAPEAARAWEQMFAALAGRQVRPAVVHGDYCPPNVYVTDDADGRPRVTGVGDFSPHTLVADPVMDLAGAVIFLELERYPGAAEDARWLEGEAVRRWGGDLAQWIAVYRRFYGFYFSSDFSEPVYSWCVRQLTPLSG